MLLVRRLGVAGACLLQLQKMSISATVDALSLHIISAILQTCVFAVLAVSTDAEIARNHEQPAHRDVIASS